MRKDKESILSTSTFSMVSGSCVRSRSNACFCMRTLSRGLMVTCRRYLRSTFPRKEDAVPEREKEKLTP